jgi:DNA (cytosine-5)-methyltransferase 1
MSLTYGSVCSGIEAATVAWHPLGWRPAFFSEIEKFPRAVLAHHYPDVPLHGDFTTIEAGQYADIDVLVGGTPCQSFSVAGLRKGLADERGNLALEFCLLAQRLGPKWVVWENVPGVLSLDGGRAFASILGGLAECGYGLAYRVLDAQFVRVDGFGRAVPQRRRRVFVVGHLGDWRRAAAVLFERESLSGNPAPRRKAGQNAAPTLAARTRGGGGLGTDFDCDGGLIAATVAPTVRAGGNVTGGDRPYGTDVDTCDSLIALNSLNGASHSLHAKRTATGVFDGQVETFVAHALRADGFDASEDGTGRGTPLVPVAAPICFSAKDYGADAISDLSPTLRSGGHNESHANAGVMPAIAFDARQSDVIQYGDKAGPLDTDGSTIGILTNWRVRRLTPRECERLQGFPDDYTLISIRGKPAADDPRYKALGNSMACNVMRWIGTRIEMVNNIETSEAAE